MDEGLFQWFNLTWINTSQSHKISFHVENKWIDPMRRLNLYSYPAHNRVRLCPYLRWHLRMILSRRRYRWDDGINLSDKSFGMTKGRSTEEDLLDYWALSIVPCAKSRDTLRWRLESEESFVKREQYKFDCNHCSLRAYSRQRHSRESGNEVSSDQNELES